MPKVSVIIPNYNHAAYLQQRIVSVLQQTYTNFELIILDDCSTDNSKDIIEQYRHHEKLSCIVYNETNGGSVFKQWHKGIELAKGEYIWIAESDDWCEANLLETLVKGLEKNRDCVLAYCQGYCINEDGTIRFQSNHRQLEEYVDGKAFIREFILPRNPVFNAGMAVWKKQAYAAISADYMSYRLSGDYLFWIELSTQGDVFISGKLLNYLRLHGNNVGVRSFKEGLNFIEIIPLLKGLLDRNIITQHDYLKTLKKEYAAFRFSAKDLPEKNIQVIEALFKEHSKATLNLQFYFFQKLVQQYLKKLLRV